MTTPKPWPADVRPTPQQFADWFVIQDRADRIRLAGQMLDAEDRAIDCFQRHRQQRMTDPAPAQHSDLTVKGELRWDRTDADPIADLRAVKDAAPADHERMIRSNYGCTELTCPQHGEENREKRRHNSPRAHAWCGWACVDGTCDYCQRMIHGDAP